MSKYAIKIEQLSKKFFLNRVGPKYRSFIDYISFRRPPKLLRSKEEVWALKDVSFNVHFGETIAVIGSNGSGKSTLLKILSHITEPTKGRAVIEGRVGSLLEVGTGFHPELTGKENIFLNGAILGMRHFEIVRQFDAIVEFSGVERFLDTPVKFYSSGMRVRLAFSVAAHLDPEILIVDEVLAVGDARFQEKCLGKMQDVSRSGRTVIFVSHQLPAVRSLCQRAVLLHQGQMEDIGPVDDVVNSYLRKFLSSRAEVVYEGSQRPGTGAVKIERIAMEDHLGQVTETLKLSEEYTVKITFEVLEDDQFLAFMLSFATEDNQIVFQSLSNREENYGKPLSKGFYTASCFIPKNILNQGKFVMHLRSFKQNWMERFAIDNALVLNAVDDGVLKKDYFKELPGLLHPALQWHMERTSKAGLH